MTTFPFPFNNIDAVEESDEGLSKWCGLLLPLSLVKEVYSEPCRIDAAAFRGSVRMGGL